MTFDIYSLQIHLQIDEKKLPLCLNPDSYYLIPLKSKDYFKLKLENNVVHDLSGKLVIKNKKFSLFNFLKKKVVLIQKNSDLEILYWNKKEWISIPEKIQFRLYKNFMIKIQAKKTGNHEMIFNTEQKEKITTLNFLCPEFYLKNAYFHSYFSKDNKRINHGISLWDHFIDFNGNNILDKNESTGKSRITSPEWIANLTDNEENKKEYSIQKNKIACYPINKSISLRADLRVHFGKYNDFITNFSSTTNTPKINLSIPGTNLNFDYSTIHFDTDNNIIMSEFKLITPPNQIKAFLNTPFIWSMQLPGGLVLQTKSKHSIVFTRQTINPPRSWHYSWIAYWSCFFAQDKLEKMEIITSIYHNLENLLEKNNFPFQDFTYHYPDNDKYSTYDLLIRKQGSCGDWALFFKDMLLVQSIKSDIYAFRLDLSPIINTDKKNSTHQTSRFIFNQNLTFLSHDQTAKSEIYFDHYFNVIKENHPDGTEYHLFDPSIKNSHYYKHYKKNLPGNLYQSTLLETAYFFTAAEKFIVVNNGLNESVLKKSNENWNDINTLTDTKNRNAIWLWTKSRKQFVRLKQDLFNIYPADIFELKHIQQHSKIK